MEDKIREEPIDEAPPIFSSWSSWYALVLAFLLLLIFAFALFSKCTSSF